MADNSEQPEGKQAGFSQQSNNNTNPYRYSNPNYQRQPQNFNNYSRNSYNTFNQNQQRPNFHYNNNNNNNYNQKRKFHGNNQFNNYGNKRQTTSSLDDQFNVRDYYHKSMLEDPWSIKN